MQKNNDEQGNEWIRTDGRLVMRTGNLPRPKPVIEGSLLKLRGFWLRILR